MEILLGKDRIKFLFVCCTIISLNNHDDNDNNVNDDCHCQHPLNHNHTTEFSFALMETLLVEDRKKFCFFLAQLFHLTIMITMMTTIMIIVIVTH